MDYIIILAGGKGLRMGTDIPKQFLPIGGLPVLMHTVKRFREYSKELNIILVLPKQQQEYWQALCDEYQFMEDYTIADGGETRFHSIKNGLKLIPDDAQGLVGVHDGVRPFPSVEVIRYDPWRRLCRGMSTVWCRRRRCLISNCIRKHTRRTTVIPSPMMLRWWRAWAVQ